MSAWNSASLSQRVRTCHRRHSRVRHSNIGHMRHRQRMVRYGFWWTACAWSAQSTCACCRVGTCATTSMTRAQVTGWCPDRSCTAKIRQPATTEASKSGNPRATRRTRKPAGRRVQCSVCCHRHHPAVNPQKGGRRRRGGHPWAALSMSMVMARSAAYSTLVQPQMPLHATTTPCTPRPIEIACRSTSSRQQYRPNPTFMPHQYPKRRSQRQSKGHRAHPRASHKITCSASSSVCHCSNQLQSQRQPVQQYHHSKDRPRQQVINQIDTCAASSSVSFAQ